MPRLWIEEMQERLFVQEINRFHFLEQQNNKMINLKIYPHIPLSSSGIKRVFS